MRNIWKITWIGSINLHRPLINFFTNKKENISIWMTYEICNAKPVLLTERLEKICDNVELKNWGIFTFVLCKIPFDCKRLFCAPVSWIKKFCGFTRKEIFYEVVCVMSLLPGNAENENYQNDFGWQPQKSHLQLSFRNSIKKANRFPKPNFHRKSAWGETEITKHFASLQKYEEAF